MILLCAAAIGLQGHQDPESRPLPPVQEPPRTAGERRDLLQKFKGPSPLAGFYRLVGVHGPTGPAKGRHVGYLAIGRDYISVHLQGRGLRRGEPIIQSGFRRYRLAGDKIHMSSLVGHRVRDGKVLVEEHNLQAVRRYLLTGTTLRIYQGAREYLDFVRIE
jgi:hypothetical protein